MQLRTRLHAAALAIAAGFIPMAAVADQPPLAPGEIYSPQVIESVELPSVLPESSACCDAVGSCPAPCGGWTGGVEYLLVRTHFSEAIAFATVQDSFGPGGLLREVSGNELDFDYESSMRFYLGYQGEVAEIRFTYWYFDSDVAVSGEVGADPNRAFLDAFGGTALEGGRIDTAASVQLNVFDLEYLRPLHFSRPGLGFVYSAGLRFADISQYYESNVQNVLPPPDAFNQTGIFTADFTGLGPYLSLTGKTYHGRRNQFSLVAKGGAALLVGDYEVVSDVTVPDVMVRNVQVAERTRIVPVLEAELGGAWRPNEHFTLSAGWLFQSWFNVGVSGGTFYGNQLPNNLNPTNGFGGADDSDIMAFDGLFVRGEFRF